MVLNFYHVRLWKEQKEQTFPVRGSTQQSEKFSTYPEGGQNDAGDLLLDRLLQDVGQGRDHVVTSQLLTELRTEGQEPNTEDHLVLELEATLVAQHRCDADIKRKYTNIEKSQQRKKKKKKHDYI